MRRAHIYLVSIASLHILYGTLQALQWYYRLGYEGDLVVLPVRDAITIAFLVALTMLLYLWCRADAKDRHIELPFGALFFVPVLFPIGVPYYFLRTYSLGRAFAHIGLAAVFVTVCIAVPRLIANLIIRYFLTAA